MNFHIINKSHAAIPFSCMQGKGHPTVYPKSGWQARYIWPWGIQVEPFAVYLTYLWKYVSTFSTSHMQHFPFPTCTEKACYSGTQKWLTARGIWPWCIQVKPYAVHQTSLHKIYCHFLNKSHVAFPFSCMQRKGHPTVDPKRGWQKGVYDLGAFKLDHWGSTKPIFTKRISTFSASHIHHSPFPVCSGNCHMSRPQKWMRPMG